MWRVIRGRTRGFGDFGEDLIEGGMVLAMTRATTQGRPYGADQNGANQRTLRTRIEYVKGIA